MQREAAVVMLIEQNIVITSTKKIRARPPPGLPITRAKIYGRAWPAGAALISASGGSVKQMGRTKSSPQNPPTGMQSEIARGTFTVGSAHSSAIDDIIPSAEKV